MKAGNKARRSCFKWRIARSFKASHRQRALTINYKKEERWDCRLDPRPVD